MTDIAISQITLSGWNPRKSFDPEAFEELKKSIQEHGILEPLIVRHVKSNVPLDGKFELVAGERRFRAAQELGLEKVPVVIKDLSDRDVREIMLIENLQRSQLEPLEEAAALAALLEDTIRHISQEDLAKKLGKSQPWIANRLRLLKAPDELKEMIISRQITPKHALALLPYTGYPIYKDLILPEIKKKNQDGQLSVQGVEDIVQNKIVWNVEQEHVLRLDEFPYTLRDYQKYFDFSVCDGCKHIFLFSTQYDNKKKRFCLNRQCWSDKINIAKQKFEKAQAAKVKKLAAKDVVDTSKLKWDEYKTLDSREWDKTECESCDKCKKNKKDPDDLICLDPPCFEKKDKAWTREQNRKAREEEQAVYALLDAEIEAIVTGSEQATSVIQNEGWTDNFAMPYDVLRGVVRFLAEQLWAEAVKMALKPWAESGKKKKQHTDWVKLVDQIPDEDLPKALLKLVFHQKLNRGYGKTDKKTLKKVLAVFEGKKLVRGELPEPEPENLETVGEE